MSAVKRDLSQQLFSARARLDEEAEQARCVRAQDHLPAQALALPLRLSPVCPLQLFLSFSGVLFSLDLSSCVVFVFGCSRALPASQPALTV